jgi:carbonic anhydrase
MKRLPWVALMVVSLFVLFVSTPSLRARSMTERAHAKKAGPNAMLGDPDKRVQDAVLASLEHGNAKFRKEFAVSSPNDDWKTGLSVEGPKAMVLACADPRVIPEKVFNAKPGELFVVRVAGNVATDEIVASLEYGAEVLGIPVLVVLGHQNCTVVKACLEAMEIPDPEHRRSHVRLSLYKQLLPACEDARKEGLKGEMLANKAIERNVHNSIRSVLENSPSMWNAHKLGKLRVVGALYSKQTGQVYWLDK